MDFRNILAAGFLLLCGAVFVQSLSSANASMPVGMQHGQFPYQHFSECDLPNAAIGSSNGNCSYSQTEGSWTAYPLFTVPSDRIFIVTGASTYDESCSFTLASTGQELVDRYLLKSYGNSSSNTPFTNGNAHRILSAGETLNFVSQYSYCQFYLEGYYAHL